MLLGISLQASAKPSSRAQEHFDLGVRLGEQRKFGEAEKEFQKAIRLKPAYEPSYYNLACCYALWGKKGEAIKSLRTLADKGFYNWPLMVDDTELDSLRDEPGFKEVDGIVPKRWEEREKAKKGPK